MHDAITRIPLAQLTLSPRNTRRTGGKDVDDLVAGIVAQGLLQNLIVEPLDGGLFGVIAGGRRLRALQQLDRDQRMPDSLRDGIPCLVETDYARITEISAAENTIRQAMHPHDEFVAFRDLAAEGHGADTIAARFGVSPLTVARRLKLANVSPVLLHEFREDRATLEQLMALAITDDHAAQERVWTLARQEYERRPDALRRALMPREIPSGDRRVQLIGLDAYEAAGGVVIRDLFDSRGGGYVADAALLDRMVEERLEREAVALREEGWSFVKVFADSNEARMFVNRCNRSQAQTKLAEQPAAELAEARRHGEALSAKLEELQQVEFDELDEAAEAAWQQQYGAIEDELDAISAKVEQLESAGAVYTDRQKAKAGAVALLVSDGSIEIERGLLPEGARAERHASTAATPGEQPAPKPEPTLAEAMRYRLSLHRTIALQAEMMKRADVALATLAHALLAPLLYPPGYDDAKSALKINATRSTPALDRHGFGDVAASLEAADTQDALDEMQRVLKVPTKRALLLPWLLQQDRDTVVSLLAAVAVMTLDASTPYAHNDVPAVELADALSLDMADHWQPTAATFFGLVPRALVLEAVLEACGKHEATRLEPMKKAELAGAAEEIMRRTGWLPKPLRRKDYALRTSKPTPAQTDTAKPTLKAKATAAKPAAKAPKK